ncbi:MAG TPA: NAD(P)-binding protein [Sphingomicrobium sp.]|nr:NAD(P)-binding protein [Sphingomicrobium sp.]
MNDRSKFRVAIVGSGPSGFYAAEVLLKSGESISVDMFDRLPTPFGLVRGGVAPDHPKIKSVSQVFDRIARLDGFRFFGNIEIGTTIGVNDLQQFYHAIIFACDAERDLRLGILGEDLPGSQTATDFVGWYNGHPDHRDRVIDLSHEVAAIVGQGNVAADVCRILATPVDDLKKTDIADHALQQLAASRAREIHVIGRRGPAQAKFSNPELRELGSIDGCDVLVDPIDLELGPACRSECDDPRGEASARNVSIFRDFSFRPPRRRNRSGFTSSRVRPEFSADRVSVPSNLQSVGFPVPPFLQQAVADGTVTVLNCGIIFGSVGRKAHLPRCVAQGLEWNG